MMKLNNLLLAVGPLLLQCFVRLLAVVSLPCAFGNLHIRENSRE